MPQFKTVSPQFKIYPGPSRLLPAPPPLPQLPIPEGIIERPHPPLTPKSSKKAFMETLLTPAHSTQEEIFDKEKVAELFMPGHTHIGITVSLRGDTS